MNPKDNPPRTLRIRTVAHLATQLRVHPDLLVEIAEHASGLYVEFDREIKGKQRHLVMASDSLAPVQRRVLDNVLCRLPVSRHAYGAIKGRSIKKNAMSHYRAAFVMKLDIRDFYPSIRFQRIYDFFVEQECSPDVARILTLLTTRKYSLPLGVSTSPFLADQIVRRVDERIGGLAKARNLNYTRYVDDITLSGRFDLKETMDLVVEIVRQAGFRIKRSKLETYCPGDGKERIITGVRVENGRISAPSSYVQVLQEELTEAWQQSLHQEVQGEFETKEQYRGKIGYVMWLDRQAGLKLLRIYRKVKWRHIAWAQGHTSPTT